MLDKPEVTLTVRLPEELSNRLNRTARDHDQTRGEIIRQALRGFMDRNNDASELSGTGDRSSDDTHVIQ